jgi:hypothetical protein
VLRPGAAGSASVQAEESRGGVPTFSSDVSVVYCGLMIIVTSVKLFVKGGTRKTRETYSTLSLVSAPSTIFEGEAVAVTAEPVVLLPLAAVAGGA